MFLKSGKINLGSSSPDIAVVLHFWFDLTLGKIEHYRVCSDTKIDHFPASLAKERTHEFHEVLGELQFI